MMQSALPLDGEVLDLPDRNIFIPDLEKLQPNKAEREDPEKMVVPVKVAVPGSRSTVWFKKDDSFEQPNVEVVVKLCTNFKGYPKNSETQTFATIWAKMLDEHLREIKY